ncbi:DEAD/DEAH box helicase [Listeria costaricensis]|uniref:DEAD/DEAH box helicase n=1 Tax=Listeria costaricensis TaxID=2026604 RepID=UPI000C07EA2E|nr:DEAD/DEAH box helicase [Listeria costaricensis]
MSCYPGKLYLSKEVDNPFKMKVIKALQKKQSQWMCMRCGNDNPIKFGQIPKNNLPADSLIYCRNCLIMGRMDEETDLYYLEAQELKKCKEDFLKWAFQLKAGQMKGSKAVMNAIQKREELLLWSVAGSGKTEMTFAGIEWALQQGLRVCLCSPRVDVCIELFPRLKEVFPTVKITCLYGDSDQSFQGEQFVIATTHQLIKFYQYFDVVLVDEVDAFPYAQDPYLEYAVKKAAKDHSAHIYITATPSPEWQRRCSKGEMKHVKIPARYHQYKLPEPRTCWIGNWSKCLARRKIPTKLVKWLSEIQRKRQRALIFFPEIKVMEEMREIMQTEGYEKFSTVHSGDKKRKEKVEALRNFEIEFLLTTTILERGVTFENVQVAVFGAEGPIFTEAALVQIAGRAGRKIEYPTGDVCFFHYGITKQIRQAIRHVQMMNRLGRQEGLLREGE